MYKGERYFIKELKIIGVILVINIEKIMIYTNYEFIKELYFLSLNVRRLCIISLCICSNFLSISFLQNL